MSDEAQINMLGKIDEATNRRGTNQHAGYNQQGHTMHINGKTKSVHKLAEDIAGREALETEH